ncbi:hypothetical protein [Methylocella sp.]|uniref:hypothetical protein n=1 Tax=Methylocella sp. TaxID=1978226 RepID=UPI0037845CE5
MTRHPAPRPIFATAPALAFAAALLACAQTPARAQTQTLPRDVRAMVQPIDIDFETDRSILNALQAGVAPFLPAASAASSVPTGPDSMAVADLGVPPTEYFETTAYTDDDDEPRTHGMLQRTAWWALRPLHDGVLAIIDVEGKATLTKPGVNIYDIDHISHVFSLTARALRVDGPASNQISAVARTTVTKGKTYWVQVGQDTRNYLGATRTYAKVSYALLPPGGGIVALPEGGDPSYCAHPADSTPCPQVAFDVFNMRWADVGVAADGSSVGGAYGPGDPATLTIAERHMARITFSGATDADVSRPVTSVGAFRFVATAGGTVVAKAHAAGIVALGAFIQKSDLSVSSLPTLSTASSGTYAPVLVKVANKGPHTLSGCVFGENVAGQLRWAPLNANGTGVAASLNRPVSLRIGETRTFALGVRPMVDADAAFDHRSADYYFKCPAVRWAVGLADTDIAISNIDPNPPARVAVSFDVANPLAVPAAGAIIHASALNGGESATATATARYAAPTNETDPTQRFSVAVCPSSQSDAACLKSTTQTLALSAPKGTAAAFKIAVRPPSAALQTTSRRRIVDVTLRQDNVPGVGSMLIGGQTVDVSKK